MSETNHNNKKNVSLGKPKKTGCLYYAPAGTALPTDATTALPAAYTCVGYLSEDGVTNATDTDTTDINEMGGIKVLSEISGYGETWQFNMIETNEASLKLRFGTANVTGTADKLTVYHAIPSGESLVLVFEIAMTGNRVKRIVVADGTITEFDDTTYSAGDAIGYGVTMSANPSDLINGATSVEYIANVTTASLSKCPPPAPAVRRAHPSTLKGHEYGSQAAAGPQDPEKPAQDRRGHGRHRHRRPRDLQRPRHGRIPLRPPERAGRRRQRRVRHRPLPQEAVRRPVHGDEGRAARPRHRPREHRQGQRIHRPAPRTGRPKLLTLIGMLATAPDALEADFQRFYGLNPDLIWTGELPADRAAALAANLPRQAIIWQKLDPRLAWDDQTYLLADIRDSLAFLAWTKTKEASRKGARWRGQLQRPGTVRHEATGGEAVAMDDEQLAAYLAAPRTTIREA
jgi:hypothetical protein